MCERERERERASERGGSFEAQVTRFVRVLDTSGHIHRWRLSLPPGNALDMKLLVSSLPHVGELDEPFLGL